MRKVTPFLMFSDQLEAAIALPTATFPDSRVEKVARTGADGPVTSAEFGLTLEGPASGSNPAEPKG